MMSTPKQREQWNRYQRNYRASHPRETRTAAVRRYRAKYKEVMRLDHYRRKYGLTLDDAREILRQQGWRCAICLKSMPDLARNVNVDHDHSTGKVRGMLCDMCNKGLGALADSTLILEAAIAYLHRDLKFVPIRRIDQSGMPSA